MSPMAHITLVAAICVTKKPAPAIAADWRDESPLQNDSRHPVHRRVRSSAHALKFQVNTIITVWYNIQSYVHILMSVFMCTYIYNMCLYLRYLHLYRSLKYKLLGSFCPGQCVCVCLCRPRPIQKWGSNMLSMPPSPILTHAFAPTNSCTSTLTTSFHVPSDAWNELKR